MKSIWKAYENIMKSLWKANEKPMISLWNPYKTFMKTLCNVHKNPLKYVWDPVGNHVKYLEYEHPLKYLWMYTHSLPRPHSHLMFFFGLISGKCYGDCEISMTTMISPPTFTHITPLHALAIACTSNLPASGLGNSLTVSNLPSGYTPRMLLKLFQANYPSAYRATIPPLVEAKKVSNLLFMETSQ